MLNIKEIIDEINDISEALDPDFSDKIKDYIETLLNPDEQAFVYMKKQDLIKNKSKFEDFERALLDKWLYELKEFSLTKSGLFDGVYFYTFNELIKMGLVIVEKNKIIYFNRNTKGSLVLPKEINSLESRSFENCNLSSIILSDNIKIIPDFCFINSFVLERVEFGYELQSIGESAFSYSAIKEIDLPEGLLNISKCAFSNCVNLVKGKIPSTLEHINSQVFFNTGFRSVGVINSSMDTENNLEIGENLIDIGDMAFACSENLVIVNLPNTLKGLSRRAFNNCPIEEENFYISPSCYIL